MAGGRPDDNICTFARSFDRRAVDPWVIRAVYDELQEYFRGEVTAFPVRASDSFSQNLRLDPEELEDLVEAIAKRINRSLEDSVHNPYYGELRTVGNLVHFLASQPKENAA